MHYKNPCIVSTQDCVPRDATLYDIRETHVCVDLSQSYEVKTQNLCGVCSTPLNFSVKSDA